jgi:hypothetical protein
MADSLVDANKYPIVARLWNAFLVVGTLLGVFGGGSAIYQTWIKSPDEQRIAVALDISRSYLREITPEMIDLLGAGANGSITLTDDQQLRLARYGDTLEYYARLANKDKLDTSFLSRALVCAIILAATAATRYKFSIPTGGEPLEMIEFARTKKCSGPAYN